MAEAVGLDLKRFLSSLNLGQVSGSTDILADAAEAETPTAPAAADPALAALAALVLNVEPINGRLVGGRIQDLLLRIDGMVSDQLNEILHHETFQSIEAAWRGVDDLVKHTNFRANIEIDILDVSKDEVHDDFEDNSVDLRSSALFRKVYIQEFDQFGGKPYGAIVGLYSFDATPKDLFFLRQISKVAATAHAPFLGAVSPHFFGCNTAADVAGITDLEGLLRQPRFGAWNTLRDHHESAYVALALPRYLLRTPWHPETNPTGDVVFTEESAGLDNSRYLWGNPAILIARNVVRSFELTGWCQYLRGPKAGGMLSDLSAHRFLMRDESELKLPLEVSIPDHREIQFANAGFVPVIAKPGTNEACVFSCQSIKLPKQYQDRKDTENAQLIANLAYSFSISRIAHYLKCVMRDNIGTTADVRYVTTQIRRWLEQYVTSVPKPDDLTLSFYPFKAVKVEVSKSPGLVGKFACSVAVLPHVQFEGVDVELRLESRLG